MSYTFEDDRVVALRQLKKNAPSVFQDLIMKKTNNLNKKINSLRTDYSIAKEAKNTEKMKEITKEGKLLKEDLQIYLDIKDKD